MSFQEDFEFLTYAYRVRVCVGPLVAAAWNPVPTSGRRWVAVPDACAPGAHRVEAVDKCIYSTKQRASQLSSRPVPLIRSLTLPLLPSTFSYDNVHYPPKRIITPSSTSVLYKQASNLFYYF